MHHPRDIAVHLGCVDHHTRETSRHPDQPVWLVTFVHDLEISRTGLRRGRRGPGGRVNDLQATDSMVMRNQGSGQQQRGQHHHTFHQALLLRVL
jgi:hypothetical protein